MIEIPTPWVAIVVEYGEGKKHLYWSCEAPSPDFFQSEEDARAWADSYLRRNQDDLVLIAKATHLAEADVRVNTVAVTIG